MRVVFLDVDGVLNSMRFVSAMDAECQRTSKPFRFEDQLDEGAISLLNQILREGCAVAVLSSSWRLLVDMDEMLRLLRAKGFTGELVGATPNLSHLDRGDHPLWRGDEIAAWIAEYPRRVTSLVILDDGSDMAALQHRLVQTDPIVGLTAADVARAIAMLVEA